MYKFDKCLKSFRNFWLSLVWKHIFTAKSDFYGFPSPPFFYETLFLKFIHPKKKFYFLKIFQMKYSSIETHKVQLSNSKFFDKWYFIITKAFKFYYFMLEPENKSCGKIHIYAQLLVLSA